MVCRNSDRLIVSEPAESTVFSEAGDMALMRVERLIASAIMEEKAGDGGTEGAEEVDVGEDWAATDAKDIRRRFVEGCEEDDGWVYVEVW